MMTMISGYYKVSTTIIIKYILNPLESAISQIKMEGSER